MHVSFQPNFFSGDAVAEYLIASATLEYMMCDKDKGMFRSQGCRKRYFEGTFRCQGHRCFIVNLWFTEPNVELLGFLMENSDPSLWNFS